MLRPVLLLIPALALVGVGCGRDDGSEVVTAPSVVAPAASPESPVDGLSPAEVQAIVEEPPPSGSSRGLTGAVFDEIVAADGSSAWRVRIPGTFTVGSARIVVSVGGTPIGPGYPSPDLETLTAVTTDPAPLRVGAEVTFSREGGEPVSVGPLGRGR